MQCLKAAQTIGGDPVVHEGQPVLRQYSQVMFVPSMRHLRNWPGVYDAERALVPESGMWRGPALVLPDPHFAEDPTDTLEGRFLYLGPVHPHYGHCLLSTISRLWSVSRDGLDGRKILYDTRQPMEERFKWPFFGAIMRALNITPADFHFQKHVSWVNDVLIPAPSFVELSECWTVFGDMMRRIGRSISPDAPQIDLPAAYLSKTRLTHGVWRFENEIEIEEEMAALGAQIIYPESLSFEEQVALFNSGRRIVGTMGSAIHTSVFARRPVNLTVLTNSPEVLSNFSMIDQLSRSTPTYVYSAFEQLGADDTFSMNLRIENPVKVAKELFAIAMTSNSSN